MLNTEWSERERAFVAAVSDVDAEIQRWNQQPGVLTVLDTSFYITHPDKLDDVDLVPALGVRNEPIRVVVPILIVDELDGLKRSGDRHTRWRAGLQLSPSSTASVKNTLGPAVLRPEDFTAVAEETGEIPRGKVTLEVLFDPPGHGAFRSLTTKLVRAWTRRAGQRWSLGAVRHLRHGTILQARQAGLNAVKLDVPLPATKEGATTER